MKTILNLISTLNDITYVPSVFASPINNEATDKKNIENNINLFLNSLDETNAQKFKIEYVKKIQELSNFNYKDFNFIFKKLVDEVNEKEKHLLNYNALIINNNIYNSNYDNNDDEDDGYYSSNNSSYFNMYIGSSY
ncbi:hypothetical protein [Mesomycoplasma neurolyticum]|uniref:Uncharacterized protein n=1 Tax=Mesomycoplasma neurolyticum TaxID=2120 RepID=A0A449A4A5_9BACT|nr:hypothetical protein [Mesomycoplasma neurolyticum]VEU59069.1 Uncharacterised protein [Mesomycoplasma neurolyticum]